VGEPCLLGLVWSLLSCSAPVPPAAPRLPLHSSPQWSAKAALLRSFELASDAIMTISFIRLPHSCLNLFLSCGPRRQTFWDRDDVPITVCPLCLVIGKIRRNSEVLLVFKCSTIPSILPLLVTICLLHLCLPLLPPKSAVKFKFWIRGSARFLINERNSASCGFSTNSNRSLPKR